MTDSFVKGLQRNKHLLNCYLAQLWMTMLQLQNMTVIEFLLESGVCIYVYHTR